MFDLVGSDIAQLDDEDLRELVRRLCIAELREAGLPSSGVTAGGHQDASDGGVDVLVETTKSAHLDFVPKPTCIFQTKATEITPAQAAAEMAPSRVLRNALREVFEAGGAYVMVASRSSVTHTRLQERLKAMQKAAESVPGSASQVHFYDRDRLSSWVAKYPGVALWVRDRLGQPLAGWKPFGAWANSKVTGKDYVMDDAARVVCRTSRDHEHITVQDAIGRIRVALSSASGAVRVIGLSGVGKTRLAQALFEERSIAGGLDPAQAVYADLGSPTVPAPAEMLARLQTQGRRAILVIDNCNPDAHRSLIAQLTPKSCVSLLTIEYDVSDEEREETEVFELEPSSDDALEKILGDLAPALHPADRRKIVEFSSGNARIALALASAVARTGSVGRLDSKELLDRLFWQRNNPDRALRTAAEVCALVYSFDGESIGEVSELRTLGSLAGTNAQELYAHVVELGRRDLIQARGPWRALLPHALANRLAANALENSPPETLLSALTTQRLIKSFSRRLSFLHDCAQAVRIAEMWFADPEWLGNPAGLNPFGHALYMNVAPLAPASALAGCLRALGDSSLSDAWDRSRWAPLLFKLAYEPEFFDAATWALVQLRVAERSRPGSSTQFTDLFHLYLSGTLAPAAQRLKLVERLMDDEADDMRECGREALRAMLEAHHFSLHHDITFGARSRTYGLHPTPVTEVAGWYTEVLQFIEGRRKSDPHLDQAVLPALARALNALWKLPSMPQAISELARRCEARGSWPELWFAMKRMLKRGNYPQEETLRELESYLRPRGLSERITAAVFGRSPFHWDDDEEQTSASEPPLSRFERIQERAIALGHEAALAEDVLLEVYPKLFKVSGGQQHSFCRGLAETTPDLGATWVALCNAYVAQLPHGASVQPLCGFILGAQTRDRDFVHDILDSALLDNRLGPVFAPLQASVLLDERDVARAVRAAASGVASHDGFEHLATVSKGTGDETFATLVREVAAMPDGLQTASEMLSLRLYVKEHQAQLELAEVGRELLCLVDYEKSGDEESHRYRVIASVCLTPDQTEAAGKLCAKIAEASRNAYYVDSSWGELVSFLFRRFPTIALDAFVVDDRERMTVGEERFSLLDDVPADVLTEWAMRDSVHRFTRLALWIRILDKDKDVGMRWSKHATLLIEHAPDLRALLDVLRRGFRLMSWMGSEHVALQPYLNFARELAASENSTISEWARGLVREIKQRIARAEREDNRRTQSFE